MIQLKSAALMLLIVAVLVVVGTCAEIAFSRWLLLRHIGLAP